MPRIELIHGNSIELMTKMTEGCIDLVVTDPPYRIITGGDCGDRPKGMLSGNRKLFEHQTDIDNGFRYPKSIIRINRDILKGSFHPTQKPVELLEYLVKTYTNEGDVVLDATMGSGSTGIACKKLNRNFIGIEKDPKYFEIAKKRIEESNG